MYFACANANTVGSSWFGTFAAVSFATTVALLGASLASVSTRTATPCAWRSMMCAAMSATVNRYIWTSSDVVAESIAASMLASHVSGPTNSSGSLVRGASGVHPTSGGVQPGPLHVAASSVCATPATVLRLTSRR